MTSGIALSTEQRVDNVTTAVSSQNETLNSLLVVLSKLDLFIKIVDRITDVRVLAPLFLLSYFALNNNTI